MILWSYFQRGGFLMYPILLASIIACAIIIYKWRQYDLASKSLSPDYRELLKNTPTLLQPILDAIHDNRTEQEIGVIGTKQVRELEKGLYTISILAVISPLLGLTGTVLGMIKVFQVVAASGPNISPGLLAGGIWEALITTAAGLFVAIPAHVAHHLLEERLGIIAFNIKEFATMIYNTENRNGH